MQENIRCTWPGNDPLYIHYHDTEWGVPVYDDPKLFEFLILETFQAGLSWLTLHAHMQATGMVNDHLLGCFRYEEIKQTSRT
ncbi:MAG: DNA-3-methyladenine glycosylase I [Bacteroidetes bacterium]|nr:DNA-3-methyladenine glycosylase I [Bacteroidota bacterium]